MQSIKHLSDRHEREIAEEFPGGETTISSGRRHDKADVRIKRDVGAWVSGFLWRLLFECKSTLKKSYRVQLKDWETVEEHAGSLGPDVRPVMAIRFYGVGGSVWETPVVKELALLSMDDLHEMWVELKMLRERLGDHRTET